jgi:hypothetical protein
MSQIRTRHEWIAQLAVQSAAINAMQLDTQLADGALDTDAASLANDSAHTHLIIRGIESLLTSQASSQDDAVALLSGVIGRHTYGKFAELAAYDWLIRSRLKITTQRKLSPDDILGTHDAFVDGIIDHCGIYFDVKAFGFHGRLANRLKECLEIALPGQQIFIEGSWDIALDAFSQLIEDVQTIAAELKSEGFKQIGQLCIRAEAPKPVSVSNRLVSPYLLAKENALFPFRSANQFTTKCPFILLFVKHPLFNNEPIHDNFANVDLTFTRALARRAFIQFSSSRQLLNTVCSQVTPNYTLADAAKLLSAIIFLNARPEYADSDRLIAPSAIYLNPRATRSVSHERNLFRATSPHVLIDDFVDDNY